MRQIHHILGKNLSDKRQRKNLEDAIKQRNLKFAKTGNLDSSGLMQSMEKSLDSMLFTDQDFGRQII